MALEQSDRPSVHEDSISFPKEIRTLFECPSHAYNSRNVLWKALFKMLRRIDVALTPIKHLLMFIDAGLTSISVYQRRISGY